VRPETSRECGSAIPEPHLHDCPAPRLTDAGSTSRRWLLYLFVAAVVLPWFNVPRDQADSAGMMAHLHSFFVDADLLYDDEYAALSMSPLFAFVTSNGVVSNHWPTGATWLQAPGYALGLAAGSVLTTLGIGDGSTMGVIAWLGVRTWAMLVLTVCIAVLLRVTRVAGASAREARILAWCAVVGTPLLYYAAEAPLRPHLWGAAVTLAVVIVWSRPTIGNPMTRAVALGSLVGLATYVRPQLVLLGLLVVHDVWRTTKRCRHPPMAHTFVAALVAVLVWPSIHARIMSWTYGPDLWHAGGSPSRHLWHFLFSSHHGALIWCPVLLLGGWALAVAAWRRERGAWLILVIIATQLWINAGTLEIQPLQVLGTRTWTGGVAFGPRKLVDVLPLCLPAVWSLMARARASGRSGALGFAALVLTTPTALLHLAAFLRPEATTGTVHTWPSLVGMLGVAIDPTVWQSAFDQRSLPPAVSLLMGAIVALPLGVGLLVAVNRLRLRSPERRLRLVALAGLGGAALAHLWVAVLISRSDLALERDPMRMDRARAQLQRRHVATVRSIPRAHAILESRLGSDAIPPGSRSDRGNASGLTSTAAKPDQDDAIVPSPPRERGT
jgi:hypothetical protein